MKTLQGKATDAQPLTAVGGAFAGLARWPWPLARRRAGRTDVRRSHAARSDGGISALPSLTHELRRAGRSLPGAAQRHGILVD
jgi:hypothetical protein